MAEPVAHQAHGPKVTVVFGSATGSGQDHLDGLSPGEREYVAGITAKEYKAVYVASHRLLRRLLAERLGPRVTEVEYSRTCRHCGDPSHGKPHLPGPVEWNLSHSGGDYVVVVSDSAGPVGVDLERLERRAPTDRLLRRCCTPAEVDWIAAQADRQSSFLTLWTRKEAVTKAMGTGLVTPFSGIDTLGAGPVRVRPRELRVPADEHQVSPGQRRVAPDGAEETFVLHSFGYPGAVGSVAALPGITIGWDAVPAGFELMVPR